MAESTPMGPPMGPSGEATVSPDWPRPMLGAPVAFAVVLLVLGVLLLLESFRISGFMALAMGPEVYPRAMAVLLIVGAVACLVVEVRARRSRAGIAAEDVGSGDEGAGSDGAAGGVSRAARSRGSVAAPMLIAVMLVVYVWALGALGFYVSSFVFTAALIIVIGHFSGSQQKRGVVIRGLVVALLITAAIYGAVQVIAMRVPTSGLLF